MQRFAKVTTLSFSPAKNKGKRGAVLRVLDGKLIVEGVNVVKKRKSRTRLKAFRAGVVEKPCRLMFPTWFVQPGKPRRPIVLA